MKEYEIAGIENIARGVCVSDGKVLLCRPKGGEYSYLPGGHIEFGETGREALIREMKEETGLAAEAGKLLGVVESQFVQHGNRHCEINLVYEMKIERGGKREEGDVKSKEDWIEFVWWPVDRISEARLLPPEMMEQVKQCCM